MGVAVLDREMFTEAGLLREYRKAHAPTAEPRAFIDLVRERCQVPYPLADRRPWISGRELWRAAGAPR